MNNDEQMNPFRPFDLKVATARIKSAILKPCLAAESVAITPTSQVPRVRLVDEEETDGKIGRTE